MSLPENYSHVGRAGDLKNTVERRLYRFLEMLPGILAWGTFALAILFSWLQPVWVAFFMIAFVIYLLLRTLYFAFHLWTGYQHMRVNEKKDWIVELKNLQKAEYQLPVSSFKDLWHLVVVSTYKEPLEVLRSTFQALKDSSYPKDRMVVILGIEQREGEVAKEKAAILEMEFGGVFSKFLVTEHPDNIEGEIAGKGSNESFAAKKAREYFDELKISYQNIIISSLDADTVVYPQYFSCLSWYYLTTPDATRTSFQPIPLYLNNIWQAPPISRVFAFSSTFWHTMNQQRPEKLITFSSHAMSFQALVDVNFRAPNVVNDDSHIFWQCFFRYQGNYKVQSLYYPVSMDANAAKSLWTTLKNIYLQHRRWAYGVGEIAYVFFGFLKDKTIPLGRKLTLGVELLESHWTWATAPLLIFVLGWLPLMLGGDAFSETLLSYNLPRFVSNMLTFSMLGLIGTGVLSLYLLPKRKPSFGKMKAFWFVAQWILLPLSMIFLMALPALEAQTRWMLGKYLGFWVTPKHRS
ncbi:glycosyltransferase family 2 protein [Patescibacteria group bacterium]|nr:glycosyltransferase family 2 protein [Patescibacteria group bacterium]